MANEIDCLDLIAKEDRGLYSSLLFLPDTLRVDASRLYAFHLEISRIPFLISEPMPGEIRLQWWRDVLSGERLEEAKANPLAKAVVETIKRNALPVDGFLRYLDARVFDLYNDPMPDRNTLEAYLGETECFILQMITLCAGATSDSALADACGHGGVAIGINNLISRLPYDRGHQRIYIPGDLLSATGLDEKTWLADADQKHTQAIEGFVSLGNEHLSKAKTALKNLPKPVRQIFIPLALAGADLKQAAGKKSVLQSPHTMSPIKTQWTVWKAALFGI